MSPILGESSLSGPKEDVLKLVPKGLVDSDLIEIQGLLNKPLVESLTNTKLIDEVKLEQIAWSSKRTLKPRLDSEFFKN